MDKKLIIYNQKNFITKSKLKGFCKDRKILFSDKLLDLYEDKNIFEPIYKENNKKYYEPFQIVILGSLDKWIKGSLLSYIYPNNQFNIDSCSDEFKKKIFVSNFNKILPLLIELRYYYLPDLEMTITLKKYPVLDKDNKIVNWKPKDWEDWEKDRKSEDVKKLFKKYSIKVKFLKDFICDLVALAENIDPAKKWYSLIKRIRKTDNQKFKQLSGDILLAYDYYTIAEILTLFLKDTTNINVLDVDSYSDMGGGKWKIKICSECGKEFKPLSSRENFCDKCKDKLFKQDFATWKCKKCGTKLSKYYDGVEMLSNVYDNKRTKGKDRRLLVSSKVIYGKVLLTAKCGKCDRINYKYLDIGWI